MVLIGTVGFAGYRIISSSSEDNKIGTTETETTADSSGNATEKSTTADNTNETTDKTDAQEPSDTATSTPNENSTSPSGGSNSGNEDSPAEEVPVQTKSFTINAFSFGYSIETINVSPGDVVTINLTNSGGSHDWTLDEFSAETNVIGKGGTDSVTFTVPQSAAGQTYVYYCSVGNHRSLGQTGNLVVSN